MTEIEEQLLNADGESHEFHTTENQGRISKRFILVIASLSTLFDCLLMTVIVPILPVYFSTETSESQSANSSTQNGSSNAISLSRDSSLDFKMGVLFSSEAFAEILVSPFAGPLIERVGYSVPFYGGCCILVSSCLVYAFAESYGLLLSARAIQGVGSCVNRISSMAMLAASYPNDDERGAAVGLAMGASALGVLAGPPIGGLLYSLGGKGLPFFILAGLFVVAFGLVLIAKKPIMPKDTVKPSLKDLLSDPYIVIAAGAICICNMAFALLEPTLPLWLLETMNASHWQIGVIFLPCTGAYLVASPLLGKLGNKIGRWRAALIGLVLVAISMPVVPVANTLAVLVAPLFALGLSVAMVDVSMAPTLAYLVDIRHVPVYGSVFAIDTFAASLGFAFGPLIGGIIVTHGSFPWLLRGMAILNLLFAPLVLFLRNPPGKHQLLQNEESLDIDGEQETTVV